MMGVPDVVEVGRMARDFGVSRLVVEDACMELGLDPVGGVHRSLVEHVRQVIVAWIREGRI
ncbi:hypothetical protein N505_0105410 [Rhodococcus aetherivorans]|nr:hypothetical protein N505_0105410 [Rhodococcus aetherivorans]